MKIKSLVIKISALSILLLTFISFQNCSQISFEGGSGIGSALSLKNGGTYAGFKVLHEKTLTSDFTCEGRSQPPSILVQGSGTDWFIIENKFDECAYIDMVKVEGVTYDSVAHIGTYSGKTYIPPSPYNVDPAEDPSLPDLNIMDGVCENSNHKCSLAAAIQSSAFSSSTAEMFVHIPRGVYLISDSADLGFAPPARDVFKTTIRGEDPATTIINYAGGRKHLGFNRANVSVENLTFQNGYNSLALYGSGLVSFDSTLRIDNCVFKNNRSTSTDAGALYINNNVDTLITNTSFLNNDSNGILAWGGNSITLDNTFISQSTSSGLSMMYPVTTVTIRESTFSDNITDGVTLLNCKYCSVDNSTIYNNGRNGLFVMLNNDVSVPDAAYDLRVKNTTIYSNGRSTTTGGVNLEYWFFYALPIAKIFLDNSIVAMSDMTRSNCHFSNAKVSDLIASYSVFDDATCGTSGTGTLIGSPSLGAFQDNGGFAPTLMPLLGSSAIDTGDNATCLTTDQRGLPRPYGPRCDRGSVEYR